MKNEFFQHPCKLGRGPWALGKTVAPPDTLISVCETVLSGFWAQKISQNQMNPFCQAKFLPRLCPLEENIACLRSENILESMFWPLKISHTKKKKNANKYIGHRLRLLGHHQRSCFNLPNFYTDMSLCLQTLELWIIYTYLGEKVSQISSEFHQVEI